MAMGTHPAYFVAAGLAWGMRYNSVMTLSTLRIGKQEYVVVPRKDFDRLQRKAALLSDQDAAELKESIQRLDDPREKRIPWSRVKARAGLA